MSIRHLQIADTDNGLLAHCRKEKGLEPKDVPQLFPYVLGWLFRTCYSVGGGGAFFPVVASNSPDALRKLRLSSFYLSYGELFAVPSNRK